jgi:tetraacyldisaccharide 4'-kinase
LLDLLYAQGAAARRRWYERHPQQRRRLARPVVSIGNLTVGGSGKTPLVAAVARWLLDRGERPSILSRGYGRRDRRDGVVVVSDARGIRAGLEQSGDEPLMLAQQVPAAVVVVADDRHLAGTLAERQLGATVHLLDDGFQHVQLARDLDVLLTTPGEIAAGRPLPFGRLRERRDAAARADVVIVLETDAAGAKSEAWTLGISQSVAATRVLDVPAAVAGRRVVGVAGIAAPDRFFRMLADAGCDIVQSFSFADHHHFSDSDLRRIDEAAKAAAAPVVTTEKDLVRLRARAALPFECVAVPMRLVLDDWTVLGASIEAAVARAREVA